MRRTATLLSALLLSILPQLWLSGSAYAQIRIEAPAGPSDELSRVYQRAQELEGQRRWGEALTLYEEALREHPGESSLSVRHDLAKIHYDLGRRYSDSSFLRTLRTLSEREALSLYSELLLKIQSHYVTEPRWQTLVSRGTTGLKVALAEQGFAQQNLRGRTSQQVDALGSQVEGLISSKPLRTRQDAVDVVASAGRFAQRQFGLSSTAVILEFACGAAGALDEYSSYLTSDQLNDVYSQIEGNFVGLGIELKASDGALLIVKVITGSPADRGGIRPGDRIIAVNGRSTSALTTDQAADLLQGTEGSNVEVTAIAPGQTARRIALRREHVDVPSVDGVRIVDSENAIGYVKLTCFQKTTSRDLDAALWKLHRQGMKSLVIDLRGNPGGLLTASIEVVDKFVDDGVIVSTRGRSSLEDYNYTAHRAGTWKIPLVVLIDRDSASASEIFAGAIRDHRRGTIVGQRSYGKGSVQGIFPLTVAGCGVRLTTAKFYSPSGAQISHHGVQPDIVVQRVAKPTSAEALRALTDGEDPAMAAALNAARQQTAQR